MANDERNPKPGWIQEKPRRKKRDCSSRRESAHFEENQWNRALGRLPRHPSPRLRRLAQGETLRTFCAHSAPEPTPSPSQEGSNTGWPVTVLGGVRGGLVAGRFMGRVFEARRSSSYRLLRTNIGLAGRVRYPAGDMLFSATAAEFLENYHRDTLARWSADDLAAQREFVNAHLAGRAWLDWSTPAAALQLVQAGHTETALGTA